MNNLTIVAVTTVKHALTSKAIEQAVQVTNSKNVLVISDQDLYPGSVHIDTDPLSIRDYSEIVFHNLIDYIETDHFMMVQYDGMPTDATFWDNDYLKYDYIGAVWPWAPEGLNVGNGGFSIRSRKLLEACQTLPFGLEEFGKDKDIEDATICRYYRKTLEQQGIQFATSDLAKKFSAELPGGKFDTFGFHGTLCLPFYLNDVHMEFYINNMTDQMLNDPIQIRIAYGLFKAGKYYHLENFMDHAVSLVPNFKQILLNQFPQDNKFFPEFSLNDLESLLINY